MKTTIPHTYREAYRMLDELLSEEDRRALIQLDDPDDLHFDLGLWIRNNWIYQHTDEFLCDEPNDPNEDLPMCLSLIADNASDELLRRYSDHLKHLE